MAVKVPVAMAVQQGGQSSRSTDGHLENELACSNGAFGYVNRGRRVHRLRAARVRDVYSAYRAYRESR